MRKLALLVAALLVLPPLAPAVPARAQDDAAEQAAREIADARDRANAAADAMFLAESELDALELEGQALQGRVDALQVQIGELQATVQGVAVNRYTRSGTSSLPLLTGFRSAVEQAQMSVLLNVANETSAEDFDRFDALADDLEAAEAALARSVAETEAARLEFERRREQALAEVELLKDIEAERLRDEAVREALAVEEAERRRRQEDERRRAAEEQARQQAARAPATTAPAGGGDAGGDGDGDGDGGGDSGADVAAAPASGAPTGGGQTGVAGAGGRPGAPVAGDFGATGWVCPVQGSVAFGDTWGAPRSGGRSHQGVDMIGPTGLPLVAVVDGFAQQKTNRLGGNVVWLTGADGHKYYYAHLDSWAATGAVTAGTVIGYLGDSGNAQFSVPHLHFEIHPGGGAAVNPYPTVRAHC